MRMNMNMATGGAAAAGIAAFSLAPAVADAAPTDPIEAGLPAEQALVANQAGSMAVGGGNGMMFRMAAAEAPAGTTTTVTMVSRGLHANALDVASKTIIVGENTTVKVGDRKKFKQNAKCITTKPGQEWTNTVKTANGKELEFVETTPATLCRSSKARLGWVKVSGGKSGLPCFNDAKPGVTPKAHDDVEVINVNNLNTSFTLLARVTLDKSVECPGVTGNGKVEGEVKQKFNLKSYLRHSGKGQTKIDFKLIDKASVKAHLDLDCTSTTTTTTTTGGGTPPPPPPPPARNCVISTQEQKGDGRTWNINVTDEGAQVSDSLLVSDGSPATTTTGDSFVHTFPGYKPYTVVFSERFADDSTARCETTITPVQAQTPAPPAP